MDERRLKERELIVSLHEKGNTTRKIAELLDVSKSKTAFWVKRYRDTKSFEDLPGRGRRSRLSKKQQRELKKEFLGSPPDRYGGESFGWTTKGALKHVAEKYGVQYTDRGITKLLHRLNLSLITPRTEHKRDSSVMRTVYKYDFKKNSRKNIWVASSSTLTKHRSD